MLPTAPPLCCRTFALPKRGSSIAEYEDAAATAPAVGRFAVADGATESADSGRWARLLAEAFVDPTTAPWSADWLAGPHGRWADGGPGTDRPWYAEVKRSEGAFATLLGLEVRGQRWRAVAVGDCCLFRVRSGGLISSFPLEQAADFGNRPALIGSSGGDPDWLRCHGRWRPGDHFLLATDALGQWLLRLTEVGTPPWDEIDHLVAAADSNAAFAAWVEDGRDHRDLRNDDATLLVLTTGA
jgi:hypothetical protein